MGREFSTERPEEKPLPVMGSSSSLWSAVDFLLRRNLNMIVGYIEVWGGLIAEDDPRNSAAAKSANQI